MWVKARTITEKKICDKEAIWEYGHIHVGICKQCLKKKSLEIYCIAEVKTKEVGETSWKKTKQLKLNFVFMHKQNLP